MATAREDLQLTRISIARPVGYADPVMWITVTGVFAAYTAISVSRYVRRDPASWDLGIFTEAVKEYAHFHLPVTAIRGARFDLLGDHFHPALAVLAPVFRLFPSPVTLLVAQALLCAVSVIPITRAGIALLGVPSGRVIGAAYGFSWGLASLNWYDFHEVALAVPLLAFATSALARRQTTAAVAWSLPLVFVKEDQGFTVAALGLVLAFAYRGALPSARIAGSLLAVWGMAWSLLAIYVIIPHFNPAHVYPYWDKGAHLAGILGHLAAGAAVKLPTLVLILLPTAFVALRSPIALAAVPGLLLRFMSADTSYWGTGWHYNATVMPVIFAAAVDGLARLRAARQAGDEVPGWPAATGSGWKGATMSGWRGATESGLGGPALGDRGSRHAPAMMAAVAVALAFQFPLSRVWDPQSYKVSRHLHVINTAIGRVPAGATLEASLNELAPFAARDDTYWVGNQNPAPQWILFDQRSAEWSIRDVPAFIGSRHPGIRYQVVFEEDGVWVLHRAGGKSFP